MDFIAQVYQTELSPREELSIGITLFPSSAQEKSRLDGGFDPRAPLRQ